MASRTSSWRCWATGSPTATDAADPIGSAPTCRTPQALGACHIKVGGEIGGINWPLEPLIADFRRLCEQAEAAGTRIALEPMPFGQIRDLRTAVDIIDRADHAAGGLTLDIWHMMRGGVDLAEITALPDRPHARLSYVTTMWQLHLADRGKPSRGVGRDSHLWLR